MEEQNDHDLLIGIHSNIETIKSELSKLVRREEFVPVRNITYGLVAAILLAFVGSITALILK